MAVSFLGWLLSEFQGLFPGCFSCVVLDNDHLHSALDNVRHEEVVRPLLKQGLGKALRGLRLHDLLSHYQEGESVPLSARKSVLAESLCLLAPRSAPL